MVALTAAAVVGGMALAGCSQEEKREYALPESLCGAPVRPELLEPLLPPGKKVSTRTETPNGGTRRCTIAVDGKVALVAGQIWWDKDEGVSDVAAAHAKVSPGTVTGSGTYLYSSTGAVGRASGCETSEHPDQALFTTLQVYAPDRSDKAAMRKLIADYTKSTKKSDACA
ncbi:hypothetical protein [Streptomyces sp. NPDC054842]